MKSHARVVASSANHSASACSVALPARAGPNDEVPSNETNELSSVNNAVLRGQNMNADDTSDHDGLSNLSRNSKDVAQYYDDWAADYEKTVADWRYEAPGQVAQMLRAGLSAESVILDAGCGTGLVGQALNEAGFKAIDGIDVSSRSLQTCV